jgi:purine-binding chemotaxis protein CheW
MSDTATSSSTQQLVVFSLSAEEYALPIAAVHEIIRFTEPRSVASDVSWIRGVIGLRGKIIPVYDLAARLGLEAPVTPRKIVIVESGAEQVGVMVDEVEEVLTISDSQLEYVATADPESIRSVAKVDDRLVILLNPDGLFSPGGVQALPAAA